MFFKFTSIFLQFFLLFGPAQFSSAAEHKHWALLVAGSSGYVNYRHQADICHAYHVVLKHGIPPEQIIVMMYDDIAENIENPFPGNIINEPNGPNVYKGVHIDYSKSEVDPHVFLKVLSGDAAGVEKLIGRKGRVIESGPNDRIFVNFADHGATGLIAFPNGMLFADDLNKALLSMYKNKQFDQMVIYIEACESGSMFKGLLSKNLNIYATTAANSTQSSYACYYDKKRGTYLGDIYSVNWMQDSDVEDLTKETLLSQFKIVRNETKPSQVKEYGDLSMGSLAVADFQGNFQDKSLRFQPHSPRRPNPNLDAVASEDVALKILERKNDMNGLEKLKDHRASTRKFFEEVAISLQSDFWEFYNMEMDITNFSCYKSSIAEIMKQCPGMKLTQNDYALRSLKILRNLCESGIEVENIVSTIGKIAHISSLCPSL